VEQLPTKSIDTLVDDIYGLFEPDSEHEASEALLDEFANNLKDILRLRLKAQTRRDGKAIRFSALGKKDRQVWMDNHPDTSLEEQMRPQTYMKFLYGDVIEQLYLYLAKEAGHSVTHEQAEVEVGGVFGHIDAIIDGVVVDVKSASPYGFEKFKKGTVEQDDPFGYVEQLSGYASVLTPGKDAAWLAIDKVSAEMCLAGLKNSIIKHHQPGERIEHLKQVVANPEPPELCYQPVPEGKSGNMKLDTGCSYCQHKFRCFPDVRTFIYSSGPRYLTEVVRVPDVYEMPREV
jgi:hypothetical protein